MFVVHTEWDVAFVADEKSYWDMSMLQNPCDTMGTRHLSKPEFFGLSLG